jgi:hypothetical protein
MSKLNPRNAPFLLIVLLLPFSIWDYQLVVEGRGLMGSFPSLMMNTTFIPHVIWNSTWNCTNYIPATTHPKPDSFSGKPQHSNHGWLFVCTSILATKTF